MTRSEHPTNLAPLVDREGAPDELRRLEAHVTVCPACQAEVNRQRWLGGALRQHASRHAAPDRLIERLRVLSSELDDGKVVSLAAARQPVVEKRSIARSRWLAMAASVTVAALISAGGTHVIDGRTNAVQALDTEIVSSHIRSLAAAHLFDVAATDQHTVKPWFDGKLDFAPPVIDEAGAGYPLVGGRLDYVGGHEVAALVYRRDKHVINVFVWPSHGGDDDVSAAPSEQGYNVTRWKRGGMNFWAVSDVEATDLTTFSEMLCQAVT